MPIKLSETLNLDGVRLENQTSGVSNPPADTVQLINDDEIITVQTPGGLTKTLAEFEDSGAVSVDPDTSRDFHQVGTVFINGVTNTAFICTDNTASSAVWHRQVDHVTDTVDPTASDDVHPIGSTWVNTATDTHYVCVDDSNTAAVWIQTSKETIETSDTNVAVTPTDVDLDGAFGTPATVGNGFIGLLDDNGNDTDVYLCASNGTSWFYTKMTKAT